MSKREPGWYWVRVGDLGEGWDRNEWVIAQFFPGKEPKSLARQWFVYEPYRWMLEEDLLEIGHRILPPTQKP